MPSYNSTDEHTNVAFGQDDDIQTQVDGGNEDGEQSTAKPKTRRPSRAKARIQQLSTAQRAAEAEAMRYKQMYEELQSKTSTETQSRNEELKATLEQQYQALLQQMGEAIKTGDADLAVKIQDALMKTNSQLDKIKSFKAESTPQPVQQRQPAEPQLPELARMWIEEHPAFTTDELFHASAITVNNQLLREGYHPESEDFYDELSARLSKRFPEVFGISDENMVQYSQDDSMEGDSAPMQPIGKEAASQPKVRAREQIVSGSARPSSNAIRSNKSPNSQVTFSQEDAKIINGWNLDPERLAQRIKYNEANRTSDGYVPIQIPGKFN